MGYDISEVDMVNVQTFAQRVIALEEYRQRLREYLNSRMHSVAPNLSALIGEIVGARLISHAGSLTNLAKYPASTVQILGAEKALFRALKTKGNTPKYGLIFHSSFIGRASQKNKVPPLQNLSYVLTLFFLPSISHSRSTRLSPMPPPFPCAMRKHATEDQTSFATTFPNSICGLDLSFLTLRHAPLPPPQLSQTHVSMYNLWSNICIM